MSAKTVFHIQQENNYFSLLWAGNIPSQYTAYITRKRIIYLSRSFFQSSTCRRLCIGLLQLPERIFLGIGPRAVAATKRWVGGVCWCPSWQAKAY